MAVTPKPDVSEIWASAGTVVDPTPAKIAEGWLEEIPPREFENFQRNKEGKYLKHNNERGVSEWDALTEYEIGSLAIGTDNSLYSSKITANVGNDPVSSSASWGIVATAGGATTPQDNLIIGGNFDTNPWQRNTAATGIFAKHQTEGFSVSYPGPDRFGIVDDGATPTTGEMKVTKVVNAPTVAESGAFSVHSCEWEVTADDTTVDADKALGVIYNVEGLDWSTLAQRNSTSGLWVYTNKPGKYCISLQNDIGDRLLNHPFTVNSSDTWQEIELTAPPSPASGGWDYGNKRGLTITLTFMVGSNFFGSTFDTWETVVSGTGNFPSDHVNLLDTDGNRFAIQFVKIEPGSVATPWKASKAEQEIANAERYAEKSHPDTVALGAITTDFNTTYQTITGDQIHNTQIRTRKRPATTGIDPAPVIAQVYSPSAGTAAMVDVNGTPTAATAVTADETQVSFTVNATAGELLEFNYFVDSEIR